MKLAFAILLLSASAWATQCGVTSTGGSSAGQLNTAQAAASCVPTADSTVTDAKVYIASGSGTIAIGVYTIDSAGKPDVLACSGSASVGSTPGYTTISLSGCGTLYQGNSYWLATNSSSGSPQFAFDVTGTSYYNSQSCCSFSNPFGSSTPNTATFSAYLDITATGATYTPCGYSTIGASTANQVNTVYAWGTCITTYGATVTEAMLYLVGSNAAGTVAISVYDNTGGSGKPGNLICSSTVNTPANNSGNNRWVAVPISGCGTLNPASTYWLAINQTGGAQFAFDLPGITGYYYSKACCSFDATFAASSSNPGQLSAYLNTTQIITSRHQSVTATISQNGNPFANLAPTPPLGYDPWRYCAGSCTEAIIKAQSDALVSNGMFGLGYTVFQFDDGEWNGRVGGGCTALAVNASNFATASDLIATVAYVAANSQIPGLYLSYGGGCGGSTPASSGCMNQDFGQVLGYGAKHIKLDSCGPTTPSATQAAYEAGYQALFYNGGLSTVLYDASVDSANATSNQAAWAGAEGAQTVLVGTDPGTMTISTLSTQMDYVAATPPCSTPTCHNDIDLLGVGNGTLTDAQGIWNFSFFSVCRSPLFASVNLSTLSSNNLATLKNAEAIAVDQDTTQSYCQRIAQTSCGGTTCDIFATQLSGSHGNAVYAVVLVNRDNSASHNITLTFSTLPGSPASTYNLRDLWGTWPTCTSNNCGSNVGGSPFTTSYTATAVPATSAVLLALCTTSCSAL